jgi:enoyl-CoA hydratase/carnithine racemase
MTIEALENKTEMTDPNGPGSLVEYRTEDGLAILELNNAPANTYSYEMFRAMDEAILRARMDDEVHVIVIRGKGDKFFSAGADIAMLQRVTPRFKYFFCLHANETLNRLEQTPKLVIAALNGHTVGGGMEIAMACDIRIARKDSGRIGLPEVSLGVLPGTGGTQRLARAIPKNKAIELMVEGRTFSFEEARDWDIVNYIYEGNPQEYWEQVLDYARQFCPPNKASKAVGLIKRSVQSGVEVDFNSALSIERELQQQLFQSDDAKLGLSAYTNKTMANFTGK